ncbi:MAG TPA: hypothetical protein V6D37_15715 [Candidatus Sericytochromatia bacterium]|jgi:hypothetical protein
MRRQLILLVCVVLPGLSASAISAYYLLPEWAALDVAYQRYRQVIKSPSSTMKDVLIAETAQDIHRINCFAEGVGLLLGGVILSIGIHGMCTLSKTRS